MTRGESMRRSAGFQRQFRGERASEAKRWQGCGGEQRGGLRSVFGPILSGGAGDCGGRPRMDGGPKAPEVEKEPCTTGAVAYRLPPVLLRPHRLARLGHYPFTVRTGVRIPVGTPSF